MANLRTDYKDDILNTSVNTRRKFNMVNNSDGTVSFEDATIYTQVGDSFGAFDINETNRQIEELKKSVSDGKTIVADAITAKGVETATDADFATMAANIAAIISEPTIDVSYADENSISTSGSGTATTNMTLSKNSTYVVVSFYSFSALNGSHFRSNCNVTEITSTNTSGNLINLKSVTGAEGNVESWRGYRVDKVVTDDTDSEYTARCSVSGYYTKHLHLNTLAIQIV